jgi:predicted enzyme related to lactoylglutathione lyase
VQKYWTSEKWIRVSDSEGLAQLVQINGQQMNPMTGEMVLVNAIGELDVDIIMDEGSDTINAQQDVYETLSQIMPSIAPMLKPAEASAAVSILVDSSSLSASAKKVWRDATKQQPDPAQEISKKILLEGEAAKVEETKSKVQLNYAKAQSEGMPDIGGMMGQPQKFELPPELQVAQSMADIEKTRADATHKQATAYKAKTDADLAPQWAVHDAEMERAQFIQDAHENERERTNSRMLAHARRGGNA